MTFGNAERQVADAFNESRYNETRRTFSFDDNTTELGRLRQKLKQLNLNRPGEVNSNTTKIEKKIKILEFIVDEQFANEEEMFA